MVKEITKKSLSRRQFILRAGTLAAGTMAFAGLTGCNAATENSDEAKMVDNKTPSDNKIPPVPWKYNKLDVELVRRRGYENYFVAGCAYAASTALLQTIKEDIGAQWDTIPEAILKYGAGGALSWGTLCGALNGALMVMGLATAKYQDIGNELMGWYTEFPFPSDEHESYCKIQNQITTIAKSPLCHVSVSTWATEAGEKVNGPGKADRCAKLSGDVAAKAAELLNMLLESEEFIPIFKPSDEYAHCMSCHTGKDSRVDNQQGKMNCSECHDDHYREPKEVE